MGLIDQTAQLGREMRTQRQQREQEREQRRREVAQLRADRLEEKGAEAEAGQLLREYMEDIYTKLGYAIAHNYFMLIDTREAVINYCAAKGGEMLRGYCVKHYQHILREVDALFKRDAEATRGRTAPPTLEEQKREARHEFAESLAGVILALLKVAGRVILLIFLVVGGFCHLANAPYKRSKRRYR